MARINGIISGFDTDALVAASVSSYTSQIDKLNNKNTLLSWQKTAYTDIYKKIDAFRNKLFNYRLESTMKQKTAAVSNEAVLTAKAGANATAGRYTMNVTQLATKVETGSKAVLGSASDKSNIATQFASSSDYSTAVSANGGSTVFNIDLNGTTISFDAATESINDLADKINKSGAGVTARYDSTLDRMFLAADKTGTSGKIDFSATGAGGKEFLVDVLKIHDGLGNLYNETGLDAQFDLDGVTGITQKSNSFEINGISYDLKALGSTTIEVKNDTDAMFNTIKTFVDEYNSLLEDINAVIYEQKYSKYGPLTDDEKSNMSESEIKEWEEKAKSGILARDPMLMSIVNNMRSAIYTPVDSTNSNFSGLFAIGLKTGDYQTNGKLLIDETKLKAAIEQDPDAVAKIFTGGTDSKGNKFDGFVTKMYDQLKLGMDKINAKAGSGTGANDVNSSIAKEVTRNTKSINAKIETMNLKMDMYYKKYDAMESLLASLQNQQNSLTQYFSGGSSK